MIRLHLSKWIYRRGLDGAYEPNHAPVPLCGGTGSTLRRGRDEGLVPPAAVSAEYHCPECVRLIRQGWLIGGK